MKIRTLALAAGALALGLATWTTMNAQGPLYDRVTVNLPYTVTIGEKTLQPGDYVIQQLRSQGNERVLLIYSDNGMKFETSAMTIPALDPNTPEDTRVILHHFGQDYYFDRIWIQGKDYGYEFPLPPSVKEREKEKSQPVSLAAKYQSVPENKSQQATAEQQNNTAERAEQPETSAQATTPPPATTSQQTTAEQTTTTESTTTTEQQPSTTAQNTTPQNTTPQPTTEQPQTEQNMTEQNTANREMPKTAAGWLMLLLSGSALSGVGLALRRRQ